jgi:oxaloacetate decarboxylase alpha subunit
LSRPRKRGAPPKPAGRPDVKSRTAAADNPAGALLGGIPLSELRQLIRLVQRTGIGELELSSGGRSVRISAHAGAVAFAAQPAAAAPASVAPLPDTAAGAGANAPATAATSERHVAITSPMVGTFYRAPAPDADPYVEVGDLVEPGQTVCIIEAMKLMNTIESEVRGRVAQILVENAQAVEFGQKLFLIDPV